MNLDQILEEILSRKKNGKMIPMPHDVKYVLLENLAKIITYPTYRIKGLPYAGKDILLRVFIGKCKNSILKSALYLNISKNENKAVSPGYSNRELLL